MNFKNSAANASEDISRRGAFSLPATEALLTPSVFSVDSVQPGTHAWSVFTPDFLIRKGKKNEKKFFKKSRGYLVVCTVAIFSSKTKLCTNFGPDS